MGFRFRQRIKLAPGLNLNIGLGGISLSAGVRGASVTLGKKGLRGNVGLPGTGLSYSEQLVKFGGSGKNPVVRGPESSRGDLDCFQGFRASLDDDLKTVFEVDMGNGFVGQVAGKSLTLHIRNNYADQVLAWLTDQAKEKSRDIERLAEFHKEAPAPASRFNRVTVFSLVEPVVKTLEAAGFVDRLNPFAGKKRDEQLRLLQQEYVQEKADYDQARLQHETYNKLLVSVQRKAQVGDHGAMSEIFSDALALLEWPRETIVDFEFENESSLLIRVDLPEIEDFPDEIFVARIDLSGLSKHKIKQSERLRMYSDHVMGIAIRVISEAFSCLPTLTVVRLAGYTQRRNSAGIADDENVVSVEAAVSQWSSALPGLIASPASLNDYGWVRVKPSASGRLAKIVPHF